MDLVQAIKTNKSLQKIKDIVNNKGIPSDSKYIDYQSLIQSLSDGKRDIAEFLLSKDCRVNKISKSLAHDTPLHLAVEIGDLDLIKILLDKRALIEVYNADYNTPLHLAFLRNQRDIVDAILSHAEEINDFSNCSNKHKLTHLHVACTSSLPNIVQHYLEGGANMDDAVSDDAPSYAGFTAMHFAVEFKSLVAIKSLYACRNFFLDYPEDCNGTTAPQLASQTITSLSIACNLFDGGNLDAKNGFNTTLSLFHMTCLRDDHTAIERFIENGASVDTPVSKDATFCPLYTPLHFAVESNVKTNVQVLLKHGADLDRPNGYDMTPLHLALYNENHKLNKNPIVDLLYDAIKDKTVDQVDVNGLSYLHVACTRNDMKSVKILLKKNNGKHARVRPNERNFSDFTPLHFCVCYLHLDLAKFLIDNDADVDTTSLHLACELGHAGLVELLVDRGANVKSARETDEKTALHLLIEAYLDNHDIREAVYNKDVDVTAEAISRKNSLLKIAKKLMKKGCDVNAKDKDGNTVLHVVCAKICNAGNCVTLLLNYGADINLENEKGKTPFEESIRDTNSLEVTGYVALYDHVKAQKTLGLKVNKKNDKCCDILLKELRDNFHESQLLRKQREKMDEIVKLKSVKLTEQISLYDFLKLDKKKSMKFAKNVILVRTAMDKDLMKTYPIYGWMLKVFYRNFEGEPCVIEKIGKRKSSDDDDLVQTRTKRKRIMR